MGHLVKEPYVRQRWDDEAVPADLSVDRRWSISLYEDFEELLSSANGLAIDSDSFVDLAFERGRVLLQAPAGAGKSAFIESLVEREGSPEREVRVVPLARLDTSDARWDSQEGLEEWLFETVSEAARTKLLLCLDGLDEVSLESGQRLLRAIEEVTRLAPSSAVLVSDRLARRVIRASRWVLARIAPLAESQDTVWHADSNLVATEVKSSRMQVQELGRSLNERLTDALTDSSEIDILADAILEHLQLEGSSHLMDRAWLESKISKRDVGLLETHDLLWASGTDQVHFVHMLFRAYLAAWALAKRPSDWNSDWFSVVTSRGSYLEVLGFLLQFIADEQVDEFIRRVDEWNFYATMYVLSEDFQAGGRATPSLRTALLLLMGRRRFSGVPSTSIQTEDALRLHGGALVHKLLSAQSLQSVIEIALEQPFTDEWWHDWQRLFVRAPGTDALDSDIEALGSDDGVLGWTASNVLLTLHISVSQQAAIVSMARTSPNDNARWRAVHVMGSFSTKEAWDACFESLTLDNSQWVRNGALRSLILVTSQLANEDDRAQAFFRLATLSGDILDNPKWSREVERAVQIKNRPAGWSNSVAILLEDLWADADSVEDQDRWRTLSASLRTPWRGLPELGSGQ